MTTVYQPEDIAAVYWGTFSTAPRYAVWDDGQSHWLPQQGKPDVPAIVAALTGAGPSLSVFFLDDDAETHVLAIDVDAVDGWTTIERITAELLEAGIACYPERSRRGGHLWIILDRAVPAIVGRLALMAAVTAAGYDPEDSAIELRPSKDRRSSEFAGGSLRAPWMPHPDTGERFGLLDPTTGEPVHDKVGGALLAPLEDASSIALARLAERYVPPRAPTVVTAVRRPERPPEGSVSSVLAERFGVQVVPGRSVRCPFHQDAHPSMRIAADDRRAWCHSPACPAHENGRGITAWQAARLASAA